MNAIDKNIHAEAQRTMSGRLAEFALGLAYEDIPETVRERARHLLLDAIGIAYASRGYHFAKATMDALVSLGAGTSPVIGTDAGDILWREQSAHGTCIPEILRNAFMRHSFMKSSFRVGYRPGFMSPHCLCGDSCPPTCP